MGTVIPLKTHVLSLDLQLNSAVLLGAQVGALTSRVYCPLTLMCPFLDTLAVALATDALVQDQWVYMLASFYTLWKLQLG